MFPDEVVGVEGPRLRRRASEAVDESVDRVPPVEPSEQIDAAPAMPAERRQR
jgi:hypothetical protein